MLKGIITKGYEDDGKTEGQEISLKETTWESGRPIFISPQGRKIFLELSPESLRFSEIANAGTRDEKQISDIKTPMPVKAIPDNCNLKHSIEQPFAYLNNVLWMLCSCEEAGDAGDGEIPMEPLVLASFDPATGNVRLFTRETFPGKKFPDIYRIIRLDNDVVILSIEEGLALYRLEGNTFRRYDAYN